MAGLVDLRVLVSMLAAAVALVVAAPAPTAAENGCTEAGTGRCLGEYASVAAVAWTGSGFTAVADSDRALALLTISRAGEVVGRSALELPEWARGVPGAATRIDKLVAGSNGSALLVGSVLYNPGAGQRQAGLIGRLDRDGRVEWHPPIQAAMDTSVVLYSGVHDEASGRFIVVGRHTNGADSGQCTFWSQGYLAFVPDHGPMGEISQTLYGQAAPGPHNRIAFYDIAAAESGESYAVVGFATAPRRGGGCQDDMLALEIKPAENGSWTTGVSHRLGQNNADEVAFAVTRQRGDRFVLAGYGVEPRRSARSAVVATFALDGAAPALRHHPYPEGDESGGDRYRALTLADGGARILVAGSASQNRTSRNQALWRLLAPTLDDDGPATFLTRSAGSDILAAATSPDGRVLAVGNHRSGDVTHGWIGLIHGGAELAGRRPPDPDLPRLTASEAQQGHIEFSEREFRAGTGYFAADVAKGAVFETRLSFSEPTQLAVSALTAEGDIDLVLVDENERLVAFSANLGDAGEYIRASVAPGRYSVRAVAASDIDAYELRTGIAEPGEDEVIANLMTLDPESRKALDRLLSSGGYGRMASPEIGFASGAARSVLALANTVQADLSAGALAQFITAAAAGE